MRRIKCAYCGTRTKPLDRAAPPWHWPGRGTVTICIECSGTREAREGRDRGLATLEFYGKKFEGADWQMWLDGKENHEFAVAQFTSDLLGDLLHLVGVEGIDAAYATAMMHYSAEAS